MEKFSHTYTADLVAFSEAQDLPPSLHIFAEIKAIKDKKELKNTTQVIILKIRETTDCCCAILLDGKEPTTLEIEKELSKDLKNLPIRLSWYAKEKITKLMEVVKQNNSVYYIDNQILNGGIK